MKRFIILTVILFFLAGLVTVVYFKNLGPRGEHNNTVMQTIPDNASIIFEFNNDKGFYDIFNGNKLFEGILGKQQISDFTALHSQILQHPLLEPLLNGQNVFISLHPRKRGFDFLLTMSAKEFKPELFDRLSKQSHGKLLITPVVLDGKAGYTIYINSIKKRFYVLNKEDDILTGSFSKELAEAAASYKNQGNNAGFVLMPDQQNANSLANIYINYGGLSPLFDQLFRYKGHDILKTINLLPALSTLSINYKTDALMLNGITHIQNNKPISYLNLFREQQPVVNHLKDIFPSTTAYSNNFAVSDPVKFEFDLSSWHHKAGLKNEKRDLFSRIKSETGISFNLEFKNLLGNEFALITTRYQERIAIIQLKDGSKLRPLMINISTMLNDDIGRLNYERIPFYLLGDTFNILKRPYFRIIDNYMILANSPLELNSYNDMYINRKFLSRMSDYNDFDALVAERSNISFFIHFKNVQPILKEELKPEMYDAFQIMLSEWHDFYGASLQFTSADKNYYTNLSMKLIVSDADRKK